MNALIAKLGADAPLLALLPNGTYEDVAPEGAELGFVIVSQVISMDVPQYGAQGGRRAFEDALYLVEARAPSTNAANVHAAALRIDTLLEDGTLTVPGFGLMTMHREEFVRATERDAVNLSLMWTRRGGRYRVQMATN
jgi:hypothetical protein